MVALTGADFEKKIPILKVYYETKQVKKPMKQ